MRAPTVSRNFDLGFQSDVARDQLGPGAAYRMKDWIPQNGAPLRKRGGWSYASSDLNALFASASAAGVGWAPFPGDPFLLIQTDTGGVVRANAPSPSSGVLIGSGAPLLATHRPFWWRDRMIIPRSLRSTTNGVKKVYSTGATSYAIAAVGGTPPEGRVGAAWGDYVILANRVGDEDVVYFSDPGNADVWTTGAGGSFTTAPNEVLRIVPMRNFTLVWGYTDVWMLRGDTPPPGGNLAWDDLFVGNGTFDGRTVATYRDSVIWANSTGVFKSDGATLTDLAEVGGISRYYQSLVRNFSFDQGWDAAGEVDKGFYWLSIHDQNGAFVTTLVCDIDRGVWTEFTNIRAHMFATRSSGPGTSASVGSEELFFAVKTAPRAGSGSTIWYPSSVVANDADGTAVQPVIELPYYKLGVSSSKRLSRAWITYHLETAGATPRLEVDVLQTPESTAYELLSPTLPMTTKMEREHVFIRERVYGAGFRIRQVGASADTRLHEFDLGGHQLEGSR